jgi:hypothetical protein
VAHRRGKPKDRQNQRWTDAEENRLESLARRNTPTGLVADALGRTEDAVRNKASELDVSLRPTNQSPYNRRKKR